MRSSSGGAANLSRSPGASRSWRFLITSASTSRPAMSIVLNVALFGRPRIGPVIASASSTETSPRSTASIIRSTP